MDITLSETIELRVTLKGELITLTHTQKQGQTPAAGGIMGLFTEGRLLYTLHRAEEVRGLGYFLLLSRLWHMTFTHKEPGQFNSINS